MRNLTASGNRKILLNLGDVSYIDSTGIGELVDGLTSAAKAGGTMKLLRPTKRVKDLLRTSTANTILDVHEDEAHGGELRINAEPTLGRATASVPPMIRKLGGQASEIGLKARTMGVFGRGLDSQEDARFPRTWPSILLKQRIR